MKLGRLYISDFCCYEKGYIDFSQFNSVLIVGKVENNDSYSNGVGKTTIFKAIEYVLFNQSDSPLDKIIRDDKFQCKIVLDFYIGEQEYRLIRKRTRKGSTDLSLFQRNGVQGTDDEIYHKIMPDDIHTPLNDDDQKFWKDISSRRAADTEKELEKLIKTNFKSFRGIVHFMQNDFSGLTTATPEKRKALLKDIFNIIIYSKLEKLAKDKSSSMLKEIDRCQTLIDNIGDPDEISLGLTIKLFLLNQEIEKQSAVIKIPTDNLENANTLLNSLISKHTELENRFSSLLIREKSLILEKSKIVSSLKEYKDKKNLCISSAKNLIEDNKERQDVILELEKTDLTQIDVLSEKLSTAKDKLAYHNVLLQNNILKYEELKIPVPDDSLCKHCRQIMTEEHKKTCKEQISKEIDDCQKNIKAAKKIISELLNEIKDLQQRLLLMNRCKQQLNETKNQLSIKSNEIQEKKKLHVEYNILLDKFKEQLSEKDIELVMVQEELKLSSQAEANTYLLQISIQKEAIKAIAMQIVLLNKELSHLSASKAVLSHDIERISKEKDKLFTLKKSLVSLEEKHKMYPYVLQAFSSTGIPNLIIHNVLDDLQNKANEVLNQLRPGLQLSFFVEKTKTDGSEADTLDVQYFVNGRERYYEQLSGAMKVSVMFSLKLGLSYLLQQMFGTDIRFLLLDEIDQALDKASIDAFADIVRFFQNDYTIMVITHNDRLKEKKSIFSHAILVEQDMNMISRAKTVNSW